MNYELMRNRWKKKGTMMSVEMGNTVYEDTLEELYFVFS